MAAEKLVIVFAAVYYRADVCAPKPKPDPKRKTPFYRGLKKYKKARNFHD